MSVVQRAGAESRSALIEFGAAAEFKGVGAAIDTTNQHKIKVSGTEYGGLACFKFAPNAAESSLHAPGWFTGEKEKWFSYKVAIKKEGTTGGGRTIVRFYATEGELLGSLAVTAGDKLQILTGAGTNVKEVTGGLNATGMANHNGYHIVEFMINVQTTTSNNKARWFVDGVEEYKDEAAWVVQKAGNAPAGIRFGWITAETTATIWFDDMGVNSEAGAANNSRLGVEGVIGHLQCLSDKGREGLKAGGGGTTEMFKAVDNPPEGVADASKSNTSQIYGNESSITHFYEATLTKWSEIGTGGIQASDVINSARVIAYVARTTGNVSIGLKGISNPEIAEATAEATLTAGAFPTNWREQKGTVADTPTPTLSTAPVIKIRKNTASTNILQCCYMAMQVEWTPTAAAGGGGAGANNTMVI